MGGGRILFLATTLILVQPLIALGAEAGAESPAFQKCMDAVDLGALKITQWTACYENELKWQDRKLNAAYAKILRTASPKLKQAVLKGQRAWLAYRDAWCSYEEITPVAPGGRVNRVACLVEVTITQIDRLENSSVN
jgi:uncharacterized protein YecT (DUF1311 family)